jgi:single-strand DNA-binding protein
MNFNKVIVGGYLARDPDLRYLPSGSAIASFAVAVNRKWKNEAGEQQEEVSFVEVTAFGKTAEVVSQHFHKGKPILVEGRLRQDRWEDKATGKPRTKLGVVLESFSFAGDSAPRTARDAAPEAKPATSRAAPAAKVAGDAPPDDGDDVPF